MIIDIIQHFKKDLTEECCQKTPAYFIELQTITMVSVENKAPVGIVFLFINNDGFKFKTVTKAVAAAKTLIDLISEAAEVDKIETSQMHAAQTSAAIAKALGGTKA